MYDHIVQDCGYLPFGVTLASLQPDHERPTTAAGLEGPGPEHHFLGTLTREEAAPLVVALHRQLRECCDLMGIGLGLPRNDTVAEDKVRPGHTVHRMFSITLYTL
jgi:hypothetical protein